MTMQPDPEQARPEAPSLSAERWNPIIERLRIWALDLRQQLLEDYYATGYPPGAVPLPPAQVYRNLVTLRDAGSPMYWHDPQAQAELARLAAFYGPPPPFKPPAVPPLELPNLQFGQAEAH